MSSVCKRGNLRIELYLFLRPLHLILCTSAHYFQLPGLAAIHRALRASTAPHITICSNVPLASRCKSWTDNWYRTLLLPLLASRLPLSIPLYNRVWSGPIKSILNRTLANAFLWPCDWVHARAWVNIRMLLSSNPNQAQMVSIDSDRDLFTILLPTVDVVWLCHGIRLSLRLA